MHEFQRQELWKEEDTMLEVMLHKIGSKPRRTSVSLIVDLIDSAFDCSDLISEITAICKEEDDVLAKHNLARCLCFGERTSDEDLPELLPVHRGIFYPLWSCICHHDDYEFWISIARLLTDPAILPEIRNKVLVLISFREKIGIYGDEQKIYRDALYLSGPSLGIMGPVETLVSGLGKRPSPEKLGKAVKLLVDIFRVNPQKRVEEVCAIALGENTIARHNFARCLAFGERDTPYPDFDWRDHRYHRYFRLWKALVSEYEDCAFWTAIAKILTSEDIFPEIKSRVPILVNYRRDKVRWTGGLCEEEKTIYSAAKTR